MAEAEKRFLILGNVKVGKTTLFERLVYGPGRRSHFHVHCKGTELDAATIGLPARRMLSKLLSLVDLEGEEPLGPESETTKLEVVDGPATSSLLSDGQDEACSRDLLLGGGVGGILLVANPGNLRRTLVLFLQLAEFDLPTVLVLNMEDEAEARGVSIDKSTLSQRLGVEIVSTVASEGHGINKVEAALFRAGKPTLKPKYPVQVERALQDLSKVLAASPTAPRALALTLMSGAAEAWQALREGFGRGVEREVRRVVNEAASSFAKPLPVVITEALYEQAGELTDTVMSREQPDIFPGVLGRLAEHPVWGIPLAALVMLVGYFFVGELGAGMVVDALDKYLFKGFLQPGAERLLTHVPWPLVRDALLDPDFGLIPTGLFLALGVVMPVLFFFYLYFALLEDSGYLPRLSILLDRVLRKMGLNGKGVLPLVLGLSCVTMALLTTRMLDTRKERIIASMLLIMGMPCAPLLAVMLVVLKPLSVYASLTLFGWLAAQMVVFGFLANKVIKGERSEFILEIPPMRMPRLMTILARTGRRTMLFIREALPVFMLASLLLFGLDRIGLLDWIEALSRPVVHGFLGLPDQAVQVFFKTFIRRENGAAELNLVRSHFDGVQTVVTLLVMTVFTPCVNSTIVLFKEQGVKVAAAILAFVSAYAIVAGGALNWICRALSITFQ